MSIQRNWIGTVYLTKRAPDRRLQSIFQQTAVTRGGNVSLDVPDERSRFECLIFPLTETVCMFKVETRVFCLVVNITTR